MNTETVDFCGFQNCNSRIDSSMKFCTECGVILKENCPFCNVAIRRQRNEIFTCPHCKRKIQYCSECGRLYPLSQMFCVNTYCPSHKENRILKRKVNFWQTRRGDCHYSAKTNFEGKYIEDLEAADLRIDIEQDNIKAVSEPLVFGEYLVFIDNGRITIYNYGFPPEKRKYTYIQLIVPPGFSYESLNPVIVRGVLLIREELNIKAVDIISGNATLLYDSNLPDRLFSPIGYNIEENEIAFLLKNGTLVWSVIDKTSVLQQKTALIDGAMTTSLKQESTFPPLFVGQNIYVLTPKQQIIQVNRVNGEIKKVCSISSQVNFCIAAGHYIIACADQKLFFYNVMSGNIKEVQIQDPLLSFPPVYYPPAETLFFLTNRALYSVRLDNRSVPIELYALIGGSSPSMAPILAVGNHMGEEKVNVIFGEHRSKLHHVLMQYTLQAREKQLTAYIEGDIQPYPSFFDGKLFATIRNAETGSAWLQMFKSKVLH